VIKKRLFPSLGLHRFPVVSLSFVDVLFVFKVSLKRSAADPSGCGSWSLATCYRNQPSRGREIARIEFIVTPTEGVSGEIDSTGCLAGYVQTIINWHVPLVLTPRVNHRAGNVK